VTAAFEVAARAGRAVLVESHLEGLDYRLLVVGDRLVAAAHRELPKVTVTVRPASRSWCGWPIWTPDGGKTTRPLKACYCSTTIALEVLDQQGLTPDSVPVDAQVVVLRRNANLSTGGSATDVTDQVHPA